MVDFPIRVVVDPRRAIQGSRAVRTTLAGVDNQANKLRKTLADTFDRRRNIQFAVDRASVRNTIRNVQGVTKQVDALKRSIEAANRARLARLETSFDRLRRRTTTAFNALRRIPAQLTRVARSAATARISILGLTRSFFTLENRSKTLGATLTRTFAIFGGAIALRAGVRAVAEFEQTLSTVRAVSSATEEQFQNLRDTAIDLGTRTRFSARQAGEGLLFLSRAGFSVDESLGAIEGTLQLAQAGALDLGTAADIASNVLQGFRLEVNQTSRVVDVLALAANSSNTNVQQLGDALKLVAPIAAGLGVDIEETTAAISVLSNAGLQASLAGTGLRRVLGELVAPTRASIKIFEQLGVSVEQIRVDQVGLAEALRVLRDAGVDATVALEVFGQRGGPAFEVLSSSIPDLRRFNGEFDNATGTVRRIARIMDDNLKGALLAVRSALEGLLLEFADGGGILRDFLTSLASVIRALARNIEIVRASLEALAIVIGIQLARRAIPALIEQIGRLRTAIITNPLGALLTALTVAIGLVISFRDQIKFGTDGVSTLGDAFRATADIIKSAFRGIADFLKTVFGPAFETIGIDLDKLDLSFEGFFRFLATSFDAVLKPLKVLGTAFVIVFRSGADAALEAVIDLINDTIKEVNRFLKFAQRIGRTDIRGQARAAIQQRAPTVEFAPDEREDFEINFQLENRFRGAGERLGDELKIGLQKSLEETGPFENSLDTFLAQVNLRAQERLAQQLAEQAREIRNEAAKQRSLAAEGFAALAGFGGTEALLGGVPVPDAPVGRTATQRQAAEDAENSADALAKLNTQLERERELLQLSDIERQVRIARFEAEDVLGRTTVDISSQVVQAELEQIEVRARGNAQLERAIELAGMAKDSDTARAEAVALLNMLFQEEIISLQQLNALLERFPQLGQDAQTAMGSFTEELKKANLSTNELAASFGQLAVQGINRASTALAEFIVNGADDLDGLRDQLSNILKDLATQILATIIQALILRALVGEGGAGGGQIGGLFGLFSGRSGGGAVQPGRTFGVSEGGAREMFVPRSSPLAASVGRSVARRSFSSTAGIRGGGLRRRQAGGAVAPGAPFLVNEGLFSPPTAGTIVPAAQTAAMMANGQRQETVVVPAPVVNVPVQINNVRDENEIPEALDRPESQEKIVNTVRENQDAINRN